MVKLAILVLAVTATALGAKPAIRPRITGGEDAARGEFPYQISYQWGFAGIDQHTCGGTIISPQWILTAGHCVTEVPTIGDFFIIAGILNLTDTNPERQQINVVEKVVHPDFGGGVGPNDVALLRLESPLEYNEVVQPAKLPAAGAEVSGDVVLSGWGAINNQIIPIMPEHLQKVVVPILPNTECRADLDEILAGAEDDPLDDASNICTSNLGRGVSACSGDSGGPLAQDGTVVGIVSWGITPCGTDKAPSVYTKVSNFIDFIESTIGAKL